MAAINYTNVMDIMGALPHGIIGGIPSLPEAHWLYGAGFLILGGLLVVESLAGGVWHRSRLRTLVWPGALVALGLGVVIVSYVDPTQRLIHFLLGVSLVACGVFEARQRLRQIPRRSADLVVVLVLLLSGILIGPFHYQGAILSDAAQRHVLMGVTTFVLAGLRVGQSFRPTSASLAAVFGIVFMALAFQLLLMPGQHH